MGTKNNPGEYDCYADADPDEPTFTLRAKDESAPDLVRAWAIRRKFLVEKGLKPPEDLAKAEEAMKCARQMEDWRKANVPQTPPPSSEMIVPDDPK